MYRPNKSYLYQDNNTFLLITIYHTDRWYRVIIQTSQFISISYFDYGIGVQSLCNKSLEYFLEGKYKKLYRLFKDNIRYQVYVWDKEFLEN